RHQPAHAGVQRLVNDPHSALADLFEDTVAAEEEPFRVPCQELAGLEPREDAVSHQAGSNLLHVPIVQATSGVLNLAFRKDAAAQTYCAPCPFVLSGRDVWIPYSG